LGPHHGKLVYVNLCVAIRRGEEGNRREAKEASAPLGVTPIDSESKIPRSLETAERGSKRERREQVIFKGNYEIHGNSSPNPSKKKKNALSSSSTAERDIFKIGALHVLRRRRR